MVISGGDSYNEYCQDCYANIICTDHQIIEGINLGVSSGLFNVGWEMRGLALLLHVRRLPGRRAVAPMFLKGLH